MKRKNCIIGTRVQIKESADVYESFKGAFGTIAYQSYCVSDWDELSVNIDGIGTRTGFFPSELRLANKEIK